MTIQRRQLKEASVILFWICHCSHLAAAADLLQAAMTVLRRSLSAPDVLLGPGARRPGSDTEQEGYEEQDDEDTMQDEKEEAGDAVVGPLSEVVCPTTGQPVQFVAQFFVTRMLGMLGVRLKRHRIIAISQDRLYLLRIEAGSSKQPKVSYPLKACSLNCDARSSSGRAFNLRSDVGSVDNGYECRARTSLLRAVSEQADRVAKQPLLQLFHAVKQRKGGRPDVRVALRVGPTTLEQRVGDSLDIIAHSLSLLWLQRIVLFSDAPQDVLLECSAGRRLLYRFLLIYASIRECSLYCCIDVDALPRVIAILLIAAEMVQVVQSAVASVAKVYCHCSTETTAAYATND
jgi:hypothetical protein